MTIVVQTDIFSRVVTGRTDSSSESVISSPGPERSSKTRAEYDAYVAIVRAAEEMNRDFVELLRPDDLSITQYNVLRILRGAGDAGLSCGQVGDRLIRHDPDITRLLDRLERRELVTRTRDVADRRVVRTSITSDGLRLLARLDPRVDELHEVHLGHLSEARLEELRNLVEESRARR